MGLPHKETAHAEVLGVFGYKVGGTSESHHHCCGKPGALAILLRHLTSEIGSLLLARLQGQTNED